MSDLKFNSISIKSASDQLFLGNLIYNKILDGYTNQMLTDELGVSTVNINILLAQYLKNEKISMKIFYEEVIKILEKKLIINHSDVMLTALFYNTKIYLSL